MWLPIVVAALAVTCTAVKRRDFSTAKTAVATTVTYFKKKHTAITEGEDEEETETETKTTRKSALTTQAAN